MQRRNKLLLLVVLIMIYPIMLWCQTALQEISRLYIPNGLQFSQDVIANGDLNGDGRNDLVYAIDQNFRSDSRNGRVHIFYSIPDSAAMPDQILSPPTAWFGDFGMSLSYGGDVNGDGIDDLVVGSPYYNIEASGAVAIYLGGDSLSALPNVTLYGQNYETFDSFGLEFGQKVISDCDLNGDGVNDIVVNGKGPQTYWYGRVWAFLGGSEQSLTNCVFNKSGVVFFEDLGEQLSTGDVNGDGCDDIIIGRKVNVVDEYNFDYALDIYLGGNSFNIAPDFETIICSSDEGRVGNFFSNGDLNGDGYDDTIFLFYTQTSNILKIMYGRASLDSLTIESHDFPPQVSEVLQGYCNMSNDPYSDFYVFKASQSHGGTEYGNFEIYTQTSPILDLNHDYVNSGETVFSGFGFGYFLGDMNLDDYPEFFVNTHDYSINHQSNYSTILTQHFVGAHDDIEPVQIESFLVYPNPFRTHFTVTYSDRNQKSMYGIDIYDIKGRKIKTYRNIKSDQKTIDLESDLGYKIGNGVFILALKENDRIVKTLKVIHINN